MSGRPKHYGQHERRSKRSAAVFSLIQTRSTFVTVLSIGASAVYLLRIRQQIQFEYTSGGIVYQHIAVCHMPGDGAYVRTNAGISFDIIAFRQKSALFLRCQRARAFRARNSLTRWQCHQNYKCDQQQYRECDHSQY